MNKINTYNISNAISSGRLRFFAMLLLFVWLGIQYASTCATPLELSHIELSEEENAEKETKEKDDKDKICSLLPFVYASNHDLVMFSSNATTSWEPPYLKVLIPPPDFS